MVLLTLDKPYTVHARSIDRNGTGQSPSNYKLSLRNAIKCNDDHYIRATLVSAKVPSTFTRLTRRTTRSRSGSTAPLSRWDSSTPVWLCKTPTTSLL